MKSVGIDIGASSIKVVEVFSSNKGVQVTQFTEHPLNTNPAFDAEIEILEFLRGLSSTYDVASTRFVFGLRQEQVSVRNKIFPFNDRQKILKSLPFELEEDLPFSNETAIFDAKIVRSIGASAEVLACATPKNRVSAALQKMSDSGIDISILSAEGIAFANCFENWNAPIPAQPAGAMEIDPLSVERRISITVHIGHTRTLVCALENNLLIGVRSILWGGKNIADSIARRYEIPYPEALKEMQTKAFILPSKEGASYDQIVFSDTISAQVRELSRELKISILEFKAEFNGVVENVGLTGGASQILNLHAFLTQCLELPVNKTSVLTNFNNVSFEKTARTDSMIGVALGLAIEGLKKPRNPALNFMKGEFARENTYFKVFWARWGKTIQVGAASFAVFLVYSMIREGVALNLSDRTSEALKTQAKVVAKLPAKGASESGVKKYIREQRKLVTEMRNLASVAKMNSAVDVMKKVSDAVPGKNAVTVDVQKLAVTEDRVQIQGVVANAKQFSALESSLKNIAIGGITREQIQGQTKKPGIPFAFSFRVDRGLQSQVK
jgi:general secretion pathway protein L